MQIWNNRAEMHSLLMLRNRRELLILANMTIWQTGTLATGASKTIALWRVGRLVLCEIGPLAHLHFGKPALAVINQGNTAKFSHVAFSHVAFSHVARGNHILLTNKIL